MFPFKAVAKTDIKNDIDGTVLAKAGETFNIISDEGNYFLGETEKATFPVESYEFEATKEPEHDR